MAAPPRRRRPTPSERRSGRMQRRNTGSDVAARVWVAIPAAAFAIFITAYGGTIFMLGVLALGVIALGELFGMYERVRPVRLAGFLSLAGLSAAAHWGGEHQVLLATVALFPVMFVLVVAMPASSPSATARMALTAFGALWIGLAIAHAILLRDLPHGGGIIVDVLVGTFLGDTGAYFGGRALGRRRLAPAISPNKTVEGLVVGMVTAVLATWAAGLYQDWLGHGQALLLGLAIALTAPLGDLFESQVKRDAGTKDAGRLFGAHGGALDRVDAALFALVAGYYVWGVML